MDLVAKGALEVWSEPEFHGRYFESEFPDRLTLYTDRNGSATISITDVEGRMIFFRSSAEEMDNTACYTIEEFEELIDYMTDRLVKAKRLVAKYGPLEHEV